MIIPNATIQMSISSLFYGIQHFHLQSPGHKLLLNVPSLHLSIFLFVSVCYLVEIFNVAVVFFDKYRELNIQKEYASTAGRQGCS